MYVASPNKTRARARARAAKIFHNYDTGGQTYSTTLSTHAGINIVPWHVIFWRVEGQSSSPVQWSSLVNSHAPAIVWAAICRRYL